ncbi:MAG: hypothetical protein R3B84_24865 [Zavarzinella sp.]
MTIITLTEDQFDDQFPLMVNHLNSMAGWAIGEQSGCLFETYGPELVFVRQQPTNHIWTLVDTDHGLVLLSGFHTINRVGYLISTMPVPAGHQYEVPLDK